MSAELTENIWIYNAWAWLVANRTRVMGVVVVAAVAGTAVGVMNHQKVRRELAANDALLAVQLKAEGKAKASAFDTITEQYAGSGAAERATILGATALFTEGNHAQARTKFSDYLTAHPEGAFRATAMLGIAACDDAANDVEKALSSYQQVISSFPNDSVAAQAKLAMALIQESRDLPRAYKLYEEVSKMETSAFRRQGMMKVQMLGQEHPELKPPITAETSPTGIPFMQPDAK